MQAGEWPAVIQLVELGMIHQDDLMPIPSGLQGLRHLALKVTDIQRSRDFYVKLFGMRVVWQPDGDSVYLSSGSDNLALHQLPEEDVSRYSPSRGQFLDHFGFLMESPDHVTALYRRVLQEGLPIVQAPKQHRDGSFSFYLADPDGNTIQVLYEPHVSVSKSPTNIEAGERPG